MYLDSNFTLKIIIIIPQVFLKHYVINIFSEELNTFITFPKVNTYKQSTVEFLTDVKHKIVINSETYTECVDCIVSSSVFGNKINYLRLNTLEDATLVNYNKTAETIF